MYGGIFMNYVFYSINIIMPIVLVVILGYILKKVSIIDDNFINRSSIIIFKLALPITLFNSMANRSIQLSRDTEFFSFIVFGAVGLISSFIILEFLSRIYIKDKKVRGAFVQGAFRSNYIIIGYPILKSLYGDSIIIEIALLAVLAIPIFNIFSIITLTINSQENIESNKVLLFTNMLKNPMIIGIVLGFLVSSLQIKIPVFLSGTFNIISGLTTPLALICIGALFTFKSFEQEIRPVCVAALFKTILFPLLFTLTAHFIGISGSKLVAIFIVFATPTATSSFIMAKQFNSDSNMAANIVILSTLVSGITIFVGITILRMLSWI